MIVSQNSAKRRQYIEFHHFGRFLPPESLDRLQLCSYCDGEYLCREGDTAQFLYFLADGRCRVTRFLSNGKESLIFFYSVFAVLGDLELILSFSGAGTDSLAVHSTEDTLIINNNIQAIGPVWCLCLPLSDAFDLLENCKPFLHFLCGQLSQKLLRSDYNQSISLNYPVDERLASYICCYARGNQFQENYTHLAEYLGCSHRQLLRALHRFCEDRLLEKRRNGYYILDVAGLKKLAGDLYRL